MHAVHASSSTDRHGHRPSESSAPPPNHARRPTAPGASTPALADEVAELRQEIDDLRCRLASLPTIEQAKGVLVGFYGIDPETAFAVLAQWSQRTNTKLRLVAAVLVHAASQPTAELHALISQLPRPHLTKPA